MDFGTQYAQLIARRVREAKVFATIIHYSTKAKDIRREKPQALILSGGPASVYAEGAPHPDPEIFKLGIPILGICYGTQLATEAFGGTVAPSDSREYGRTECTLLDDSDIFHSLGGKTTVWMSHGDRVEAMPGVFDVIARTPNSPYAAVKHKELPFYGLQFHPEVTHTEEGAVMLENFLYKIAGCAGTWEMCSFIDEAVAAVRNKAKAGKVLLGLSGGVDSSVVALLLHQAVGDRLECIFVDNGVLRRREADFVIERFRKHFKLKIHHVDAAERFLQKLAGVTDPEEKRKVIGRQFIDVFEEEANKIKGVKYLAQGTLYPDVIESTAAHGGPTATIKSHHNVGGLPEQLKLELIEPVRELFKDEVRQLGVELGLSEELVWRHPFPGPGLAVRIIGEVTTAKVRTLQEADAVLIQEIKAAGIYREIWQAFAVLLPVRTVGVMGDERTYENVVVIRAVTSHDGMTADWYRMPPDVLAKISNRIINEVRGVNRVVYDVSSKPPGTIEWE